ncbi:MAG TPA: hypothetical protein VFH31_18100 [Pyrinomonadaceae bacterium]|nr:hypothetical protein [Pyrinomonadaceae bacterium]
MNKVVIRLLWFAFGVSVGIAATLQLPILLHNEPQVSALTSLETDVNQLISIHNEADALSKRKNLINFIWGPKGLPAALPDKVEQDLTDERYSGLTNLKQINRLTIAMDWGFSSTAYHFVPTQSTNKLLIYHRGHDGDFVGGISIIQFFLDKGFSVIALSMPLEPPNNQPIVDLNRVGKIQITFHDQLKLLEMQSGHPVQLFLTPIAISLNYANTLGYESFFMTGMSGGGWTTTVYSAIDPRIAHSYPVAGSLPIHLRSDRKRSNSAQRPADWGDYEQTIPELYRITNYLELYVLSSHGANRKQLQILNKFDPCCFSGDASQAYEAKVNQRVQMLGAGSFSVYLDSTHKAHGYSDEALNVIAQDADAASAIAQK